MWVTSVSAPGGDILSHVCGVVVVVGGFVFLVFFYAFFNKMYELSGFW